MATKSSTARAETKTATGAATKASATPNQENAVMPSDQPAPSTETNQEQQRVNLTGRAVFAVETTAAGVVVRTAFLTEDQRLLDMPAIFPDIVYALNVIDDLRQQVTQHFSKAAQVGAQVIANQSRNQQISAADSKDGNSDTESTTIKST
jgi:hypothetical protein